MSLLRMLPPAGLLVFVLTTLAAADSPQWGGSATRNHVAEAKNMPVEWNVGQFRREERPWNRDSAKNVRWVARLGSQTYGTPVVAGGKVFCATNNGAGWLTSYPAERSTSAACCASARRRPLPLAAFLREAGRRPGSGLARRWASAARAAGRGQPAAGWSPTAARSSACQTDGRVRPGRRGIAYRLVAST